MFRFHESMKRMTLSSPLRELTTPTMTSSITSLSSSTQSLSPPHTLLDFPPVAQLTNALIHAFNELRQCAPLSLAPSIAQEIKRLLESTVHDIGEYYRYVPNNYTQKSSMHTVKETFLSTTVTTNLCKLVKIGLWINLCNFFFFFMHSI